MGHTKAINLGTYQYPLPVMAITIVGQHLQTIDHNSSSSVSVESDVKDNSSWTCEPQMTTMTAVNVYSENPTNSHFVSVESDFKDNSSWFSEPRMTAINVQANFDISNSKGMGKTLRVFRSSR